MLFTSNFMKEISSFYEEKEGNYILKNLDQATKAQKEKLKEFNEFYKASYEKDAFINIDLLKD